MQQQGGRREVDTAGGTVVARRGAGHAQDEWGRPGRTGPSGGAGARTRRRRSTVTTGEYGERARRRCSRWSCRGVVAGSLEPLGRTMGTGSSGVQRRREVAATSTTSSRRLATRERGRGREEDGNEVAGRRRGEVALVIRRRRTAAGAKGSGRRAIGRGRAGGRDQAGAPLPPARCVHECVCVCCVWWRRVRGRGERWGEWDDGGNGLGFLGGSGLVGQRWGGRLGRPVGQLGRGPTGGEVFSFFVFYFPFVLFLYFFSVTFSFTFILDL